MKFSLSFLFLLATLQSSFAAPLKPATPAVGRLHAGWAMTSITPDQPVALAGQFHKRISERVESPCTATVLALETRKGKQSLEQAIMISCDLVLIADTLQPRLRKMLAGRLPGFDPKKPFSQRHPHAHRAGQRAPLAGTPWMTRA